MRGTVSIRVGLLRDTLLVVVLVSAAVVALAVHASAEATRSLARAALGGRLAETEAWMRAVEWGVAGADSATIRARAGERAVGARRAGVAVVVLGADARVLAAPGDAPGSPAAPGTLDALDASVALAARAAIADAGPGAGAVRFSAEGAPWWAASRTFAGADGAPRRALAWVHEGDLLERLPPILPWLVATLGAVLALATWRALAFSRRYSAPIRELVAESDRMSRGDLEPGTPIATAIAELRDLAAAHQRMREGLSTLVRLEDDVELARRIQQNTLPERIPYLHGFDVDAFSEPAERAGGDTYDVVGFRARAGGRGYAITVEEAEWALLLLADATGHGVGPAISATQVRAMLRMAARSGAPPEDVVRHVNDQLCDDLFGGRFITAWIALLDARAGTLTSFSAGQAPLMHYHARDARTELIGADAPPLGIERDLEIGPVAPRELAPGDVFAVLSDGILDATDPEGARFGDARAIEIIERHRADTAGLIVTRLRQALAAFAAGSPAKDDRTAIVIRRETG